MYGGRKGRHKIYSSLLTALSGALCACCAASTPPAPAPTSASTETCADGFLTTGNSQADLERLSQRCGSDQGYLAVTPVLRARQRATEPPALVAFDVPRAGACYRVLAVGDRDVQALALAVSGADPDALVADARGERWAMLSPRQPLCFAEAGRYRLEVAVQRGAGWYALQVWGAPAR